MAGGWRHWESSPGDAGATWIRPGLLGKPMEKPSSRKGPPGAVVGWRRAVGTGGGYLGDGRRTTGGGERH